MKNHLKVLLCFSAVVTLTLSPFLDLARATPASLLRVVPATDCTLYAAANGSDSNSGTSPSSPKTFQGAANATVPGSVVCLLGGRYELACSFYPPASGTSSAWITYESYGDSDAVLVWEGGYTCGDSSMISMNSTRTGGFATNYLKFIGLVLDGQGRLQGTALDGFSCKSNNNLFFNSNVIMNTSGAGIQTNNCNYVISDHNIINHNGYVPPTGPAGYSFTSGISYFNNVCNDGYTGAHFVASNNIIVGQVDQSQNTMSPPPNTPSEGNGIIVDTNLACPPGKVAPASIVVNNLIYGNGGSCIRAVSVANSWVVNNTCYINDLDTLEYVNGAGIGSIVSNNSSNGFVVNNISVVWKSGAQSSGGNPPYDQENTNTNINYYNNLFNGNTSCCNTFSPSSSWNNPTALNSPQNPQFVGPVLPYFDPAATGQYATSRPPSVVTPVTVDPLPAPARCTGWVPTCDISAAFALQSISPAYNQGIDPSTLTSDPNMKSDLQTWIYNDINGKMRNGSNWDLGAIAH